MRKLFVTLVVVAVLASGGAGYLLGLANQPVQGSQTRAGECTTWGSLANTYSSAVIPVGANITVSYPGNWRLTVAEFASSQTKASAMTSVCYYEGSGRVSFYLSYANYLGANTILALAHKWGTNGTLTLTVSAGPSSASNSTSQAYGDASASVSFLE